ncbi:MAG: SusC/RagA family TonB-linked outer membrane protein, partial [Cyclobacteriaceae bacterium]
MKHSYLRWQTSYLVFSILLLLLPGLVLAQNTISGKVTDSETGDALPGVNVLVKGTTTGTVTNVEGSYSLSVPASAETLVFSSVGYTSTEVPINNRSVIDVAINSDIKSLSEVVVIGYGTQERRALTGAVSSVSSEEISQLPNVNIAQALQGRAPGVVVTENSGRPGAAATVQIRGIGTVGNSNPLYVVDGQILNDRSRPDGTGALDGPSGLIGLNPNDIESMEVLKDASASAIYGARAANGVVLITTKRGKAGQTKLSYHGYGGTQFFNDRLEFMNAQEFVQDAIDRANAVGERSVWEDEGDPAQFGEGISYWDKLWQTGYITDHTLSLSGGNENSQFLVSLGYLKNEGVMIGQSFDRYSLRLNSDHQI